MLFGESLLGFGVGGNVFGLDFNLASSTPEFPQKMVGDIFGLLSGVFYGASMFFNSMAIEKIIMAAILLATSLYPISTIAHITIGILINIFTMPMGV